MLDVGNKRSLCVDSEDLPDRPHAFAVEATSTATEHAASTAAQEARASMTSGFLRQSEEDHSWIGSFTPYVTSNAASPDSWLLALFIDCVSNAFRPYWLQERSTTRGCVYTVFRSEMRIILRRTCRRIMHCTLPILRIPAVLLKMSIYSLYAAYMCVYRHVYSVYTKYYSTLPKKGWKQLIVFLCTPRFCLHGAIIMSTCLQSWGPQSVNVNYI